MFLITWTLSLEDVLRQGEGLEKERVTLRILNLTRGVKFWQINFRPFLTSKWQKIELWSAGDWVTVIYAGTPVRTLRAIANRPFLDGGDKTWAAIMHSYAIHII